MNHTCALFSRMTEKKKGRDRDNPSCLSTMEVVSLGADPVRATTKNMMGNKIK